VTRTAELLEEAQRVLACGCTDCAPHHAPYARVLFEVLERGAELEHALQSADQLGPAGGELQALAADGLRAAREKHEQALDAALQLFEDALR
jgi:hypothetical protein